MTREPMLPLQQEAGLALRCAQDAFAALKQPIARRVVGLVVLGKLLVVAALWTYPHPPVGPYLAPVLRAIGGADGPHYPSAYACFPRALAMLDPFLDLALGLPWLVLLLAVLPALLGDWAARDTAQARAVARFPTALLASLPGVIVAVSAAAVGDRVGVMMFGMVGMAVGLAVFATGIALASVFAYAVPAVVLGGESLTSALYRSVETAARFPRLTVAILFVEAVVVGAFRPAPRVVQLAFEPLNPESVFVILSLGGVVIAGLEALRVAVFGRLYLHAWGGERT